jgi:glycosyltransferase involved in cell wall biosynthesis
MDNSSSNVVVSVSLICFNQVTYIRQCIESILCQKTDFNFEIIIGDDGSTDGTKDIIQEFCNKNLNIVFLNRIKNIGLQKNISNVFDHCSGKYIALIEGDDFWTNENKLQLQVDFLELNKDCSVCFTNGFVFLDDFYNDKKKINNSIYPEKFDIHTYISNGISIPNNTKMFRKNANPQQLPELFFKCIQWDWLLHILHGLKGNYGYIDQTTLAYRRHENTIINVKNNERIYLDAIYLVQNINSQLPKQYWKYFKHPLYEMNSLSFHYLRMHKYSKAFFWYFKWLKAIPFYKIKLRDEFYKFRTSLLKRNK